MPAPVEDNIVKANKDEVKCLDPNAADVESIGVATSDMAEMDDDDDDDDDDEVTKGFSGTSKSASVEEERMKRVELAKVETAQITRLRVIVIKVLLLSALAISAVVFTLTKNNEKEEFNKAYEGITKVILDSFRDIFDSKLGAVSSMGVAIMAHGVDHVREWPFVTLSSFEQRAATARKESGAIYLHINPLVTNATRKEWEEFVVGEDSYWINEGIDYQHYVGMFHNSSATSYQHDHVEMDGMERWPIWRRNEAGEKVEDDGLGPFMPTWQTSPIVNGGQEVNENILRTDQDAAGAKISFYSGAVVMGKFLNEEEDSEVKQLLSTLLGSAHKESVQYDGSPVSKIYFPIFDSFQDDHQPVAVMVAWIHWMSYFTDILPSDVEGIDVVLRNDCQGEVSSYTFQINGAQVTAMGQGDLHEKYFDGTLREASTKTVQSIADGSRDGIPFSSSYCTVQIYVYPTSAYYDSYITNTAIYMTIAVASVFVISVFMFLLYDRLVQRRQTLVMNRAAQTTALLSSLFPDNVRDRLMEQATLEGKKKEDSGFLAPNKRLKGYLNGDDHDSKDDADEEDPIADLFPHCSVLFADIQGFTAWSSTRDPAQVFILLQTLYEAFDVIAKRRKVFKVETIGDSYVAVTGLPDPQPSHAVIMARFAGECLHRMNELVAHLENRLGPDTGELSMRFGIHSGPVTAGVLRGERARFQLFGDTVNTAARMESTGIRGKIQVSEATYELLLEAGKGNWAKPRPGTVQAKGKGLLKTYFVNPNAKRGASVGESSTSGDSTGNASSRHLDSAAKAAPAASNVPGNITTKKTELALKEQRLVNWIVDLFHEHLKKLVARRRPRLGHFEPVPFKRTDGLTSLDEVAEAVNLPQFCKRSYAASQDWRKVQLDAPIVEQLRIYVKNIASMYNDNIFHNFEHCCHVTMTCSKFLKRIVAPDIAMDENQAKNIGSELHNYTHGINSDPLTILAILFSALIHDVDHQGISNAQLAEENTSMRDKYRNKSIAEQHSLDIAWDLLMEDRFIDLRNALFSVEAEMKRFRQVVVNVVLATDIFDAELNGLRRNRWEKAFSETSQGDKNNGLKATIVIEHIIQASDVSHTMQHWHIYRKWNRRLFFELYKAYKDGRMTNDPSAFWFKGEIGFFDNYVIPLAKKLKECQVFGVSSDECLNYAMQNRNEWAERGEQIVAEMVQELETGLDA